MAKRNPNQNPRSTYWFGTWNIPEDLNWKEVLRNGNQLDGNGNSMLDKASFQKISLVASEERGEAGNRHLHILVKFNTRIYRTQLTRYYLNGPHWDPPEQSIDACIRYINKTNPDKDHFLMLGAVPERYAAKIEKQNELKQALKDLMNMTWLEFSDTWTELAFNKPGYCLRWKMDHAERLPEWDRPLQMKNFWIFGAPGTGKSFWARKQCESYLICFKQQNKWWDNYDDSRTKMVLIEDAGKETMRVLAEKLKIWADGYWFQGEIKHGMTVINPQKWFLIITSNYEIDDIFDIEEDRLPIKRRFKEIKIESRDDIFLQTQLDFSILK